MNLATTTEQTFDQTATEMFAVLVNPITYPRLARRRQEDPGRVARRARTGQLLQSHRGFGPLELSDRTTVRDVDAPRTLKLLVRARPLVEANVSFEVTGQGPSSCTVRRTETPIGIYRIIPPLARPMIRARNDRSMERLRQVADQARPDGAGVTAG